MSSSEPSSEVLQMMEITGVDATTAQHFLEAFGNNLEAAVSNYMVSVEDAAQEQALESVHQENANLERDIAKVKQEIEALRLQSPLEAAIHEVAQSEKDVAIACIITCGKYMANVANNPLDPKFQTIKLENKAFNGRVGSVPGGKAILLAVGFEEKEETLVLAHPDLEQLRAGAERMIEASQAITAGEGTSTVTGKLHVIGSDSEYEALIQKAGPKLVVIDFFADWCGPCQRISPQFALLAEEFKTVVFVKIDTEKRLACSEGVQSLPTFRFIKAGKTIDEFPGADLEGLRSRVHTHMNG